MEARPGRVRARQGVALGAGVLVAVAIGAPHAALGSKTPTPCRLHVPTGQQLRSGVVALKGSNRRGMFEGFQLVSGGVRYTVATNFYDGRRSLTRVVNLACKEAPVQFIQVASTVRVVGRLGGTTTRPFLRASVVQVLTYKDRGA